MIRRQGLIVFGKETALVLVIFILCIVSSQAATIYVPNNYLTIQDAIDAATNGDTIIVRPGTYVENIDFLGKEITLISEQGPEVTIIDGGKPSNPDYGSVVTFINGESPNTILEGFTITNGTGRLRPYPWNDYDGAGIYCGIGSSPTIRDNIIMNNWALGGHMRGRGGGIFCDTDSSTKITRNIITNNSSWFGGGIASNQSSPIISNNLIAQNTSWNGGGIYAYSWYIRFGRSPTISKNRIIGNWANYGGGGSYANSLSTGASIINNIISENVAVTGGGGICCWGYSFVRISNNIISRNRATGGGDSDDIGGGILSIGCSNPTINNNTIVNNYARLGGGGICSTQESSAEIVNTIFWNNNAPEVWIMDTYPWNPSSLSIAYSDLEGGQGSVLVDPGHTLNWGIGMIDADPLFVDQVTEDYHLTFKSPCINKGYNHGYLPTEDFEGDPRVTGGIPDIGADEYYYHLYHMGDVVPGGNIDVRVIGMPGTSPVRLLVASNAQKNPQITPYGELYLVQPIYEFVLGGIPSNGVFNISGMVSTWWVPGNGYFLQAMIGPLGGPDTVLTNPYVLEIE